MGFVVKGVKSIGGALLGTAGSKAAKRQAAATLKAAEMEAANDRVVAQGAQQTREAMLAQNRAAQSAAELLSVPQDKIDVQLATTAPAEVDPATGRKRTTRSNFMSSASPGSGIKI